MTDDVRIPVEEAAEPDDQLVDGAERPLPPIPDGGLGAGMPDWLTRPTPATLRRLARRQGGRRPEAADFARAEDVPAWLAAIRARDTAASAAVDADEAAPAFPRIEPMFVEARPPVDAAAVDAAAKPEAVAAAADAPTPTLPLAPAPAPSEAGGTPAAWIVVAILLALGIAFAIGMLAGAGYRP